MKKIIALTLALVMAALTLTACGGSGDSGQSGEVKSFSTIGEVIALNPENSSSAFTEDEFVWAFEDNGIYYRVIADLSPEVSEQLWALEYDDPDYDQKYTDLISPLAVKTTENLSEKLLTEEQIKDLIGKTGQELLDAGWHCYSGYNIEDMVFWMDYGPFTYSVYFNEKITDYNMDTFDAEEGIKDLTVKNIEFFMLGDGATNLDEE